MASSLSLQCLPDQHQVAGLLHDLLAPTRTPSTSLDILNPASSNFPSQSESTTATARYLAAQILHLWTLIATRQFGHHDFERLVDENFKAFIPHFDTPVMSTRQAWLDNFRTHYEAHPEYNVELVHMSTYSNEKSGRATVWMHSTGCIFQGDPCILQRESITIGYWRRSEGRWKLYKQIGMRGFGGNV